MDMCRLHHDYCLMNGGGDAADRELAAVAAAAGRHLLDLSHDIWLLLTGDIPELRGDDIVEKLLDASVQENVATLLHVFEHGLVPDDLPAPAAAVEYARRLAQRGVPIVALVGRTASATAGSCRGASTSSPAVLRTPTWPQPSRPA
jgi:hypothetical protein